MNVLYNLMEHSDAYAHASAILMECECAEEYDGAIEEALKLFESAEQNLAADAGAIARIYRNLQAKQAVQEAQAAQFKQEYDRLSARAKATKAAADRWKWAMCMAMEMNGLQKVRTDIGTWFTKEDVLVEVTDPYAIPAEFAKLEPPKADTNAIKRHYKYTGELIPGVEIHPTKGAQFR